MLKNKDSRQACKVISSFSGRYFFLSNLYQNVTVHNGMYYQSAESAFQASRCCEPSDRRIFADLDGIGNGYQAKELIRQFYSTDEYTEQSVANMIDIVSDKFYRNPELLDRLLATGNADIINSNDWHDRFWGVDKKTGTGRNWLGLILQTVRNTADSILQETVVQYQNGNIKVSRTGYDSLCDYTVLTEKQFPPYMNAVEYSYMKQLTETHMAAPTGLIAADRKGKLYPIMIFNPALLCRTHRLVECHMCSELKSLADLKKAADNEPQIFGTEFYHRQAGLTENQIQQAQRCYEKYWCAYEQVRNYEFWLGLECNESQLVKDVVTAWNEHSTYPFRHKGRTGMIDYDFSYIDKNVSEVAYTVRTSGKQETGGITIPTQQFVGADIGRTLLHKLESEKEQEHDRTERL